MSVISKSHRCLYSHLTVQAPMTGNIKKLSLSADICQQIKIIFLCYFSFEGPCGKSDFHFRKSVSHIFKVAVRGRTDRLGWLSNCAAGPGPFFLPAVFYNWSQEESIRETRIRVHLLRLECITWTLSYYQNKLKEWIKKWQVYPRAHLSFFFGSWSVEDTVSTKTCGRLIFS